MNFELFQAIFGQAPQPAFWEGEDGERHANKTGGAIDQVELLWQTMENHRSEWDAVVSIGGLTYTMAVAFFPLGRLYQLYPKSPLVVRAGDLAAQLRQHITGAATAFQLLEGGVEQRGEGAEIRHLATLNQSLHRLLRVVGQLDMAQDHRPTAAMAGLDLAGFCRDFSREVEYLAGLAKVAYRYDGSILSLITVGDEEGLRTLLTELISNAIKAAGAGGEVILILRRQGGNATLTIADTGPGLAEGELEHYFSGGEGGLSVHRGLGLGMPTVGRIVAEHEGVLFAHSGNSGGLRVTVSLPIHPPRGGLRENPPKLAMEEYGGFSPILRGLSNVLPWQAFLPRSSD